MRNWLSECKVAATIQPVTGTGAASPVIIDTKGYSIAKVFVSVGATADDFTTLKIEHGDASNLSDAADLKTVDLTDSSTDDPDDSIFGVDLDLRNVGRYIRVAATKGTGNATYGAFVILGNAHASPVTATDRGYDHVFGDPA